MPVLIVTLLVLFGIAIGEWGVGAGREQACAAVWDGYFNSPTSQGGCGGDLANCPVEAPDAVSDALHWCNENTTQMQ